MSSVDTDKRNNRRLSPPKKQSCYHSKGEINAVAQGGGVCIQHGTIESKKSTTTKSALILLCKKVFAPGTKLALESALNPYIDDLLFLSVSTKVSF